MTFNDVVVGLLCFALAMSGVKLSDYLQTRFRK